MMWRGGPTRVDEQWSRSWWNGQTQAEAEYVVLGSLPDGRWYISRGALGWMTFDCGEDALLVAHRLTSGWQELHLCDDTDCEPVLAQAS
jgi:hypothetical protein